MKSRTTITSLIVVFVASAGFVLCAPVRETIRNLAALPAIGALVSALFVLLREHLAHDRALLLHQLQASTSIGTTSHMANVAFDKHVEFSEEYLKAAIEVLGTLVRRGPTEEAVALAQRLYVIRRKWALMDHSRTEL